MKFTIGTASSNMEFKEDLKLIKSSLLYADEIELIGMAEYAVFNYLPKCLSEANEINEIINYSSRDKFQLRQIVSGNRSRTIYF